jgi:antitoxin (DNA-binding transcriptional repressor) of toxin-antitoxin stability system
MTISVEQAQSSLKELIQKISQGEQVVITQDHKPVAELRSVAATDARTADAKRAWLEFQKLGNELAATSVVGAASLTEAVSQARR